MSSLCFAVAVVELRRPARPRSDHQTVMASADSNTRVVHRRDIVRGLVWVTSSSLINSAPAYSSDLFHPTLSSVAGKVPGGGSWFGPRDVVYPEGFSGTWVERRERVSVETPLGPARVDARILQRLTEEPDGTQTRDIRFVPYREGVVADRWYNACSGSTFGARPKVTQCQWDPDNPNVLSEELEDGRTRETKVTRRRTTSEPAGAGSFEWVRISIHSFNSLSRCSF